MIHVLDYASTVWNPHTNKNSIALKEFKTVVFAGFVGADFVLIPIDGLDHLKNVVQSYFGHHSLLEESICLWPWSMTFFIIMFPYSLVITSISPPLQPSPIHCPFYANSLPLTLIVTRFSWTVFFCGTLFLSLFCQLPAVLLLGVHCIIFYVLIKLVLYAFNFSLCCTYFDDI